MATSKINNSLALNRVTTNIKSGGTSSKASTVALSMPDSFNGDGETINTTYVSAGPNGLKYATVPSGVGDAVGEVKLSDQPIGDVIPGGNGLLTSIKSTDPVITASGIYQDIDGKYRDSKGTLLPVVPAATRTLTRVNNIFPSGDRDSVDADIYGGDYHTIVGSRQLKLQVATTGTTTQNS